MGTMFAIIKLSGKIPVFIIRFIIIVIGLITAPLINFNNLEDKPSERKSRNQHALREEARPILFYSTN